MAGVVLEGVSKTYPNGHFAVRGLHLAIEDGELMVLVGPSGSGKSSVLRMIAGLERPTAGRIRIGDRDVTLVPPDQRDVAMVFQSYALYPHMTVRQNLGFGLRMRGTPRHEIERRVGEAARALDILTVLDRKPAELSGGQRQRVALGRAIVREPLVFLFDEPLSNLDPRLRVETRAELARLHRRLGATVVHVTHDQEEAMTLGTRVAVLQDGVLQQVAPPLELYQRPANRFVASFVGSPEMNFLPGDLVPGLGRADGLVAGVRPHDIAIGPAGSGQIDGWVDVLEPRGSDILVHLAIGARSSRIEVRVVVPSGQPIVQDQATGIRFDPVRVHWFDGDGNRIE